MVAVRRARSFAVLADFAFDRTMDAVSSACYEAGVNFKATGDCLIIAPQFICEEKHIDEIIDKLRTGITNYQKNQKN